MSNLRSIKLNNISLNSNNIQLKGNVTIEYQDCEEWGNPCILDCGDIAIGVISFKVNTQTSTPLKFSLKPNKSTYFTVSKYDANGGGTYILNLNAATGDVKTINSILLPQGYYSGTIIYRVK